MTKLIRPTPWDAKAFGLPTWELLEYSAAALDEAVVTRGHHTIKVDPLADKRLLHERGFYYCDTLIEPYCDGQRLRAVHHSSATISRKIDSEQVLAICHGAFSHGRFHRDFNLSSTSANFRYDNWLKQLIGSDQVYGLYWECELAGFVGYAGNCLVLHAVAEKYRGKGIAKYWWSLVCAEILESNGDEVKSSISASNLAIFKLYASLGFSFRDPLDIYHRMTE